MSRGGPLVVVSRGRRPLWSYCWGLGFFLCSQWVNFLGPCHAGNKMTLTESTPPLKLSTHAILLLLSSRVQEGASRCPLQHTWVEDSGELNRPFYFSAATSAVSPPECNHRPSPRRHQDPGFPVSSPTTLSLFLPTEEFLRERGDPCISSFSLELASSKSYPCSWDTKPHSSAEMTERVSSTL